MNIAEAIIPGPLRPCLALGPEETIADLRGCLGPCLLAGLVGRSDRSLLDYRSRRRAVPPEVIDRLHFLSVLGVLLAGSFNDDGIRRWWERPRLDLDGRTPREMLHGEWSSTDEDAGRVLAMALTLLS